MTSKPTPGKKSPKRPQKSPFPEVRVLDPQTGTFKVILKILLCVPCKGTGLIKGNVCPSCDGTGELKKRP